MAPTLTPAQSLFAQHSPTKQATDSGAPESQIAHFTHRIKHLTTHLQANPKDNTTKRTITTLVAKRKRQLRYLAKEDHQRYQTTLQAHGLRK